MAADIERFRHNASSFHVVSERTSYVLKKALFLAAILAGPILVRSQTTAPILLPHVTFVDASGAPCTGCKLYSYVAGTTTPLATYTDASGVTPNTNPVVLDVAGGAQIWLGASSYKFTLKTSLGVTIWTVDNVAGFVSFCAKSGCTFSGAITGTSATFSGGVTGDTTGTHTGNVAAPVLNTVQYPTTFTTLQSNLATCASATCTIVLNTSITTTADLTTPSNVTVQFNNGAVLTYGAHALTINGPIQAPPVQIFSGSGALTLGTMVSQAPVEWMGAVGDWNGTTGTDNLTAIQSCFNALTKGKCTLRSARYKITGTLTISKSAVGMSGVVSSLRNDSVYPNPQASEIIETSNSANILIASGTDLTHTIVDNEFTNFTLSRTVVPTNTAAGLALKYTYGARVDGVFVQDSGGAFFIQGSGSQGTGYIQNSAATWGYNGFLETSGSFCAFCVDGTLGPNNSLRIHDTLMATNTANLAPTLKIYGLLVNGGPTHDLHTDHMETAEATYAIFVQPAGSGFFDSSDMFIRDAINDGCFVSCVVVIGLQGSIQIDGGWENNQAGSSPIADIQGSSHVSISHNQFVDDITATGTPISVTGAGGNSGGIRIQGNDIIGATGSGCITLSGVGDSVISGNLCNGPNSWGTNVISLLATSHDIVVGTNTINGTATNGIFVDPTSLRITGLETNSIGDPLAGTITTPINDASFNGPTVVQNLLSLPYAASGGGFNCLQIDTSGHITNTGAVCGAGGGGSGTVTSVAMTVPSWLSVAGSPVTTSGTLAVTANSQSANLVLASPNGSSGAPTFRALATADLPAIITATQFQTNAEFSNGTCTTAKTIDPANGNRQKVTLTNGSTCALTFTQPASGTATVQLKITQSAVSTFNGGISGCKWPGGVVPTITQTTGAVDMLSVYLDGTTAYCQIAQAFS